MTVLDPSGNALIHSTYLGGDGFKSGGFDLAYDIALDCAGNAYVTGYTKSSSFPTVNPVVDEKNSSVGAFVSKIDLSDQPCVSDDCIAGSFDTPGGGLEHGLAFDGVYLWHADYITDKIYKLDTAGNVIDSFDSPGPNPQGLTFDGVYLWNADFGDSKIF